jgi:radical SAM superfamily enzyme YgiQ (UPF0313 family)
LNGQFSSWYQNNFARLSGSGIWLKGIELNRLPPEEYERRELKLLIARLSSYYDTRKSFTHQLMYQLACESERVFPDLAFLPGENDRGIFEKDSIPWLLGTQTKQGPIGFDVIGFSNSIIQELLNIPAMLLKSGIPLKRTERLTRKDVPIIILGGANAINTSCLWHDDGWVDGVFIGEGTQDIRALLELFADGKKSGLSKTEQLEHAGQKIPGFITPETIRSKRKKQKSVQLSPYPLTSGPMPLIADSIGEGPLQISEGCPCFCSFCSESWMRKPYREIEKDAAIRAALTAKAGMGLDSLELYSFNFNAHSQIQSLLEELLPRFRTVGLKSQRLDIIARDPSLLELERRAGKSSFTFGIEGISARMRRYLRKSLPDEELWRGLEIAIKSKPRDLKLFFIATGIERDEDFSEFSLFLEKLSQLRLRSPGTRIILSVTPLVRFPWTPLEYAEAQTLSDCKRTLGRFRAAGKTRGFEFREACPSEEYWLSQLLARLRGANASQALASALTKSGFLYSRSVSPEFAESLRAELESAGINQDGVFASTGPEQDEGKPWALIESGVSREFLWREFERISKFEDRDYCLPRTGKQAQCLGCGACQAEKRISSSQRTKLPFNRSSSTANQPVSVLFDIQAGANSLGLPRKALGIALARALMLQDGRLGPSYLGYLGSFWDHEDAPVWISGTEQLKLAFASNALPLIKEITSNPEALAAINGKLGGWGECEGLAERVMDTGELLISSKLKFDEKDYFRKRGLKYTIVKKSGAYVFELTPVSLKKGYIRSFSFEKTSSGIVNIALISGAKFDIEEFIQESFAISSPSMRPFVFCQAK